MVKRKLPKREGPILSKMFGLADTGACLNMGNLDYQQSFEEHHPNLVLKFLYMKDMDGVDPFDISVVCGGK